MEVEEFKNMVFADAATHGINVVLSPEKHVEVDGSKVAGYFCSETKTLAAAMDKPQDEWFHVLVHEYCHMRQWIDDCDAWKNSMLNGVDKCELLFYWVDGIIELNDDQLRDYAKSARNVELDCERRVLEIIHTHDLPIDQIEYAQKGNSYVIFYDVIPLIRKWYPTGRSPYTVKDVYTNMPTEMVSEDYELTEEHKNIFRAIVDIP